MRFFGILCLLPLLPLISAATISGNIAFNEQLSVDELPPTSQISVDHGLKRSWVKKDGSFEIFDVEEGEHHLEPIVPGYFFRPLIITVAPPQLDGETNETPSDPKIHVQAFNLARKPLAASSSPSMPHPVILEPLLREDYFTAKSGMNVLGLLKNPMVLMMLFSGVMMYGMPKLMSSMGEMDPELSKDMTEARQKLQGIQNGDWSGALSNILNNGNEKTTSAPEAPAKSPSANVATPAGRSGGKKKRK